MEQIKLSKKQIIILLILLLGLAVGLYLVQTKQIFKSRANTDIQNAVTVKDGNGNPIGPESDSDGPYYQVNTEDVNIQFDESELETLFP